MKRTSHIIFFLFSFFTLSAQTPQKISYQAVIRDASELLLVNQTLGIRISIMDGAVAKYAETHTASTNGNALISVEVGSGTPVSGTFSSIDWADGPYTIKAEFDPAGGTTYTLLQSDQILSLPFALTSKTAGITMEADYNDLSNLPVRNGSETKISAGTNISVSGSGTVGSPYIIGVSGAGASYSHFIGEFYQGGIIVGVWKEGGIEKGLITTLTDIGVSSWSNINGTLIGATAQSYHNGQANSTAIITQPGHIAGAAYLCDIYTNPDTGTGVYSDWYLPAIWELNYCYDAAIAINAILGDTNGFQFVNYWSSTEYTSATRAYHYNFSAGQSNWSTKSTSYQVRAVRRF